MIKVFFLLNSLSVVGGYLLTYYFLSYVCLHEECGWSWWGVEPSLTIIIYLILSVFLQFTNKVFPNKKMFFLFLVCNILLAIIFTVLFLITIYRFMYFDLGLKSQFYNN